MTHQTTNFKNTLVSKSEVMRYAAIELEKIVRRAFEEGVEKGYVSEFQKEIEIKNSKNLIKEQMIEPLEEPK